MLLRYALPLYGVERRVLSSTRQQALICGHSEGGRSQILAIAFLVSCRRNGLARNEEVIHRSILSSRCRARGFGPDAGIVATLRGLGRARLALIPRADARGYVVSPRCAGLGEYASGPEFHGLTPEAMLFRRAARAWESTRVALNSTG